MSQSVLVTGASGFVGSALVERMLSDGRFHVRAALRQGEVHGALVKGYSSPDLGASADWLTALQGVQAVLHCAGRVHVMNDQSADPLDEFRRVNVVGTLRLARQAVEAGVSRFVFLSSIKVNGEGGSQYGPYIADAQFAPTDPYGISKMEAEQGLRALAAETGMQVVIIRPVLVYGPGVKANFLSMMRWLHKGVPLPFGAIHNSRSLVALDNLVDLIVTCIDHPAAANKTFLVSDGEDLSITELLRRMGKALGKPARLLPVPAWLLALGAKMLGRHALAQRLLGSLQVDISKTCQLLNWTPPVTVDEGLRKTAQYFLEHQEQ